MAPSNGETRMKCVGNLWAELAPFPNLLAAGCGGFLLDLEWELLWLQRELKDGS
jgi:hypothetical protein